jgi:hypothetical protein
MKRRRRVRKTQPWPKDAEVLAGALNHGFESVVRELSLMAGRTEAAKHAFDLHLEALGTYGGIGPSDSMRYQSTKWLIDEAKAAGWL